MTRQPISASDVRALDPAFFKHRMEAMLHPGGVEYMQAVSLVLRIFLFVRVTIVISVFILFTLSLLFIVSTSWLAHVSC
jgi:hypothetical protein